MVGRPTRAGVPQTLQTFFKRAAAPRTLRTSLKHARGVLPAAGPNHVKRAVCLEFPAAWGTPRGQPGRGVYPARARARAGYTPRPGWPRGVPHAAGNSRHTARFTWFGPAAGSTPRACLRDVRRVRGAAARLKNVCSVWGTPARVGRPTMENLSVGIF